MTATATANGRLHTPLDYALAYSEAGVSVVRIKPDGSKRPVGFWTTFQERRASKDELREWFTSGRFGIGTVGGKVSGNLEILDFDDGSLFEPWCELVEAVSPGLVGRLNVCQTPRRPAGRHVRYRCTATTIPGNTDIAYKPKTDPQTGDLLRNRHGKIEREVTIQTRGEGGQALAPGTPSHCHPTGRSYEHVSGPGFDALPDISPSERDVLWNAARALNQCVEEEDVQSQAKTKSSSNSRLRPGDDFNTRGPDYLDMLTAHGWINAGKRGTVTYVKRPGKKDDGWSGTIGFCKTKDGADLFAVFSSNADPFVIPAGRLCGCFDKFSRLHDSESQRRLFGGGKATCERRLR